MSARSSFHQRGFRTANSLDFVDRLTRSDGVTSRLVVAVERSERAGGVRRDRVPHVDGARAVGSAVRKNQGFEAEAGPPPVTSEGRQRSDPSGSNPAASQPGTQRTSRRAPLWEEQSTPSAPRAPQLGRPRGPSPLPPPAPHVYMLQFFSIA